MAILLPLLALLTALAACSRSKTPDTEINHALATSSDLSPVALAASPDGQNLYVA